MEKDHYYQSYSPNFWQWEELGNVISIPRGSTIAYRAYLEEIMPLFRLQGLPPMGSLLLAIIATNRKGADQLDEVQALIVGDVVSLEQFMSARVFLNLLTELSDEYKTGNLRSQLFRAIFEGCHGIGSLKQAPHVIHELQNLHQIKQVLIPKNLIVNRLLADLKVFEVLYKKFKTVDQIIRKIAGLPELDEELILEEEQVPFTENGDLDFVDELIQNDRTEFIGKLVRHLWGGLSIPFHSALPSAQPMGGISDLTNKGDFDRLLISEFANEDLVFLSRLANNEALYIQREIPPQHNNLERVFLIDSSIKNWGTPKTIAYAIMIAIASHPKTDIPCKGYVVGEDYQEVNPLSLLSIINSLPQLSSQLSCANGIAAYLMDFPSAKNREVFVITEASTLKNASMLATLHDKQDLIDYWIYTDAEGGIEIYKKQQRSKRFVQRLQLALDDLWKKEKIIQRNKSVDPYSGSFPILFQPSGYYEYEFIYQDDFCVLISSDHKLFCFDEEIKKLTNPYTNEKGIRLIHDHIPSFGQAALGKNEDGDYVLVVVNANSNKAWCLNLSSQDEKNGFFDKNSIQHGDLYYGGDHHFYYFSKKGNWKISCNDFSIQKDTDSSLFVKLQQREKLKKQEMNKFPKLNSQRNVYKNVSSVAISELQCLVFGIHELSFNVNSNHIRLRQRQHLQTIVTAKTLKYNLFEFNDGSTIEIHSSGMYILKSSSADIPIIFIPAVLSINIGVSTSHLSAGSSYFLQDMDQLTIQAFEKQFMKPFIETILKYGT